MKKNLLAALIATTFVAPTVLAEAPSYSYVDINYIDLDVGLSVDGFGIAGSVELGENFFINGEYAGLEGNVRVFDTNVGVDVDMTNIGFGYKSEFGESSSWFASYTLGDLDFSDLDVDANAIRVGLRSMTTESLELNASIVSYDFDASSSDPDDSGSATETGFQVGLAYTAAEDFQIILDVEDVDGLDSVTLGARFNF